MNHFIFDLFVGSLIFNIMAILSMDKTNVTADNSPNYPPLSKSLNQQKENTNTYTYSKLNDTVQLVKNYDYPIETHYVFSKSGYILVLHRIPGGKLSKSSSAVENGNNTRTPVVFHHGGWQSSLHFVATDPEHSLALILADEGYDVWLVNDRGNCYSNQHTTLKKTDPHFWNFSLDEMAREDFFRIINFILRITDYESVYYIGYSFGSQIFFAGASLYPEYNNKVKLMIALSPMAYMAHTKSPILASSNLVTTTYFYEVVQATFGYTPVPDEKLSEFLKIFINLFCKTSYGTAAENACASELFGNSFQFQNYGSSASTITRIAACPTSSKTIIHLSQLVNSNQFAQYDHRHKNIEIYGQLSPPLFKLWTISTPIAIMWAKNDNINDPVDVEKLVRSLPNVVENYQIPSEKFSQMDFLFSPDAKELVYTKVLEFLRKY